MTEPLRDLAHRPPFQRALTYCAFEHRHGIALPRTGVQSALVREIEHDDLRVLWSEVDWPFSPSEMQRHAVEFHQVVAQVFSSVAVAPFSLLTIFPDLPALESFIRARAAGILADLTRLRDLVQMECVLYVIGDRSPSGLNPEIRQALAHSAAQMQQALHAIGAETRIRKVKSGLRIFTLAQRGTEMKFTEMVEGISLHEGISRRTSGPRPATEFLAQPLKPSSL